MGDMTRMMQRLDMRGRFSLTVTMEPRVARTFRTPGTEHGTTTEYTQVNYPVWKASLVNDHPRGWVWDLFGFATETTKGDDLEQVLAELLTKTEPRFQTLEDRVWEHVDYRRECQAAQPMADLMGWLADLPVAA